MHLRQSRKHKPMQCMGLCSKTKLLMVSNEHVLVSCTVHKRSRLEDKSVAIVREHCGPTVRQRPAMPKNPSIDAQGGWLGEKLHGPTWAKQHPASRCSYSFPMAPFALRERSITRSAGRITREVTTLRLLPRRHFDACVNRKGRVLPLLFLSEQVRTIETVY